MKKDRITFNKKLQNEKEYKAFIDHDGNFETINVPYDIDNPEGAFNTEDTITQMEDYMRKSMKLLSRNGIPFDKSTTLFLLNEVNFILLIPLNLTSIEFKLCNSCISTISQSEHIIFCVILFEGIINKILSFTLIFNIVVNNFLSFFEIIILLIKLG